MLGGKAMNTDRRGARLLFVATSGALLLLLAAVCSMAYEVGVKPGDWAVYGEIYASWESTNPEAVMPAEFREGGPVSWGRITVADVTGSNVRLEMTQQFKNGTETKSQSQGDLATGMGNLSFFLYPSGLGQGDSLPTGGVINETLTRSYAGASREVNLLSFHGSVFGTTMTNRFYFDKMTGVVCELFIGAVIEQGGYTVTTSTTMKLTETNIWQGTEIPEARVLMVSVGLLIFILAGHDRESRRSTAIQLPQGTRIA
jgi:hypothetical protein